MEQIIKYFVDAGGNYLGAFCGATPPEGAIEVPSAPSYGLDKWGGEAWIPYGGDLAATLKRFRDLRAKMCDALGSIAGRMQRAGDTTSALALDAAVVGLLSIPEKPSVLAATDVASLELAIVTEYRVIAYALATTAPAAAAEFDKLGLELV